MHVLIYAEGQNDLNYETWAACSKCEAAKFKIHTGGWEDEAFQGLQGVRQQTAYDCFAACVATITKKPIEELPPADEGVPNDIFWEVWQKWAVENGYLLFYALCVEEAAPRGFSILRVRMRENDRDFSHALVCQDGEIVWNPANGSKACQYIRPLGWVLILPAKKIA